MKPSRQCLERCGPQCVCVNYRLVAGINLAFCDSFLKISFQPHAHHMAIIKRRMVVTGTIFTLGFGRIHRDICTAHQFIFIARTHSVDFRTAYTDSQCDSISANFEGCAKPLQDGLTCQLRANATTGSEQYRKLVPSGTSHKRSGYCGFDAGSSLPQEEISGRVTIHIVRILEAIEIHIKEMQRSAVCQMARYFIHQRPPVWEPCQKIMKGMMTSS